MSEVFRIRLPDGRAIDVRGAPDFEAANEFVTRQLEEERRAAGPQEDNRPLMGPGSAMVRGVRTGFGGPFQGLGGVGEQVGVPGAGYVREFGNWIAGEDPRQPQDSGPTRSVRLSDFGSQPLAAVGALGGEVLGNIAGLVGTGLGAGLMARMGARAVGAGAAAAQGAGRAATVGGMAVGGALAGQPELEGALIAEGISPERALELSAYLGPLIGAGEVIGPLAMLKRVLGREASQETAQTIARLGVARSVGREARFGAGTEILSEVAGETARQGVVAAETGNLNAAQRAEQIALAAIGGGLGGGAMGVPLGVARHSQAVRQVEAQRALEQAAQDAQRPSEVVPERAPPIPPPPEPMTTVEEAQEFIRREGGEARPPVDLSNNPEGLIAWANSRQAQDYAEAVERQRGLAVSRFIGAPKFSQVRGQPDANGETQIVENRQLQRDMLYKNLIQAAAAGQLDLNNFSADDVVRQALAPLEVDDPSPNERAFVRETMKKLVDDGLLLRGERGKWRIKPLDVAELEAKDWERQKAAAQKPATPGEPTLSQLDEERRQLRAEYPELLRLEDEAHRTQELKDFLETPDAKKFLRELLQEETKPGISYNAWQRMFKRATGFDLTPEQGGLLHQAAMQQGLVSRTNQIDKRILAANAKRQMTATGPVAPVVAAWQMPLATNAEGQQALPGFANVDEMSPPPDVSPPAGPVEGQGAFDFNAAPVETSPTTTAPTIAQPPVPSSPAVATGVPPPAVVRKPKTEAPLPPIPPAPPPKAAVRPAFAPNVEQKAGPTKAVEKQPSGQYLVQVGPNAGNLYPSYNKALAAARVGTEPAAGSTPAVQDEPPAKEQLIDRSAEELVAKGGVNTGGLLKLLGPSLYGSMKDIAPVSAKELLQNSYDAIKSAIKAGQIKRGRIYLDANVEARTLSIIDNGVGMTPKVLSTKFLEIAGSGKEAGDNSGGFGIAKILFLYGSDDIHVVTMRDGKVSEMRTSGNELTRMLTKGGRGPTIQVREPTAADRKRFPEGHGTFVQTTIPPTYLDPGTGQQADISMVRSQWDVEAVRQSPLFADIDVQFNTLGVKNVGMRFDPTQYDEFVNVKAPWGSARLYISKAADGSKYGENLHVLSNGLWQYSRAIKEDPQSIYGPNVPYTFYLDLKPAVGAHDALYPFQPNRQGLKGDADRDVGKILRYVNAIYAYQTFSNEAKDFGAIAYVDPDSGRLSTPIDLSPQIKPVDTKFTKGVKKGSNAVVKNGELFVDGKKLPDIPVDQLALLIPKNTDLKIDPALIDTNKAMLHSNLLINDVPVNDYMRQKFGGQYDEYLAYVADSFRLLRNEVARVMGYPKLLKEAVGVSLDKTYRGVSIKIPFEGQFVNPLAAESQNVEEAAFGIVGTMIHELAHHQVRSHNESFPQEMQRILYKLLADKEFSIQDFLQDFAQTIEQNYKDIQNEGYRLFNDSDVNRGSIGERFRDSSAESTGDGAGAADGQRGNGGTRGAAESLFRNFARSYQSVGQGGGTQPVGAGAATTLPSGPALTPTLPSAPIAAAKITQQLLENQITGPMRWFASPITTMPALRPALRGAADVLLKLAGRRSQMLQALEPTMGSFLKLDAEARTRVTRAWERASVSKKTPPYAAMAEAEAKALKELLSGPQRALDYFIESAVWQHFDPEGAVTPQQKAKLEAFWEKHKDKHLWEIPKSERQAASPEGEKALIALESKRNPFYMPVIAQGSHFVAAYKADGKGNRAGPPVRMYDLTPRNMFQRMMGYEDPLPGLVAELQREFPNSKTHVLQLVPQQFKGDAEAAGIRNSADTISQYLSKLSEVSGMKTAEAQRVLASMADRLNKEQMERIFRPNRDILRPITSYNEGYYVADVLPRYYAGMASIAGRRYTQEAWTRALKQLSVNDKQYLNELRDYATTPTEAYGGLRTLSFFWLMGFAMDTAVVNALQVPQVTVPIMIRDGGAAATTRYLKGAYRDVGRQMAKTIRARENVASHLTEVLADADEKVAVQRAHDLGTLSPVYTDESKGQVTVAGMRPLFGKGATKAASFVNKAMQQAAVFQQTAEQVNRIVTFLAAYRMAKADPSVIEKSNRFNNTTIAGPDAAYQYATKMVQDTQYVTTKEDRAYFQRFTPAAELMTQFMSFPAKTVELYARHFLKTLPSAMKDDPVAARMGALGFLMMLAPMITLAGVWSLPFAESLKEIFEKIVGLAWGSTQNFDADMKRWMGGGFLADFMTRGLPHAANVVSLSKRLAVDPVPYQELTTTSALSLLGPAASIPEAYARAMERAKRGDYGNALALILPRAMGNVVRAGDLVGGSGEYRSDKGRTLVSEEQLGAMAGGMFGQYGTPVIAAKQALGFQTPEVTNARDRVLRGEEIDRQVRDATERLNSELARYMTEGLRAQQRGDAAAAQREFNSMTQRLERQIASNIDLANSNRLDLMVMPNMGAVRRRAIEDLQGLSNPDVIARRTGPLRRERAMEDAQLYR